MKIIGLTGGIASGKSTVAKLLEALDISVVYADKISAIVLSKNQTTAIGILGKTVLNNGVLDKTKIKTIVFKNSVKKQQLENLLHPKIRAMIQQKIVNYRKTITNEYLVVEVPLLFEAGWQEDFDEIWIVRSNQQKQRLLKRDNLSNALADKIIKSQELDYQITKQPQTIINNNSSLSNLQKKISDIVSRM